MVGRERPLTAANYERTNRRLVRKMALMMMNVGNGVYIKDWHHLLRGLRDAIDDVLSYDLPASIVVQVDKPLDGWVEDLLTEAHDVPDTLPEGW